MKYKGVIAAAAVSALFISPFIVSADTLSDLQTQLQALLSQVSSLQTQIMQLQASSTPSAPVVLPTPTPSSTTLLCPVLPRTLTYGSSGTDVSQLQTFLTQQGVYSDEATGFYGAKTQAAVQAWQSAQGLVASGAPSTTGWGVFGPNSRGYLSRLCPGTRPVQSSNQGSFSISPSQGTAPLTATFTVSVPSTSANFTYTVYFGDGASAVAYNTIACAVSSSVAAGGCPDMRTASHTYAKAGTYTASVYRDSYASGPCQGSGPCGEFVSKGVVAVLATNSCKVLDCAPGYHVEGTACSDQQQCVVNPISSGGPVVTGVDGPASLQVGQTGTWILHASVATNADQNLKYAVIWGDEGIVDRLNALAYGASTLASGTFTHSYATAGTYTPLFTVSNSTGSAQAGASVTVGSGPTPTSCPVYSLQACLDGYTYGPGTTDSNGCFRPGSCIPKTTSSASISATPASGAAPLSVHFTGKIPGVSYMLDYGDGSQPELAMIAIDCAPTSPNCAQGYVSTIDRTHVYAQQGTYTVKLSGGSNSASATVTVTGGTTSSGVTAAAQGLTVTISAPTVAQKMQECKYSVGFFGSSGNGLTVDWGDGIVSPVVNTSSQGASCTSEVTSHTYASGGTYTIKARSWHPGPTDIPTTDWEGSTSVTLSGAPVPTVCPVYQLPLCSPGAILQGQGTGANGCPLPSKCVMPSGINALANTTQTASALSALQAALEKLKAFLGQ